MRSIFVLVVAIALLCISGTVQAIITIDTVTVGDVGNAADSTGLGAFDYNYNIRADATGYGQVNYNYNIGKYEVTAGQYTEFLNAKAKTDTFGLYNDYMANVHYGCNIQRIGVAGSYIYNVANDWANIPVNNVSFWDAVRFANWLNNGQGNGDTESGAYTLDSYNGSNGRTIQRNVGATWAVASDDEWYKAAYYDPAKDGVGGYWDYATMSNHMDSSMANYGNIVGHKTVVGSYGYASAYGTYDQGGNVWEWNESLWNSDYANREIRGGSWAEDGYYLGSTEETE